MEQNTPSGEKSGNTNKKRIPNKVYNILIIIFAAVFIFSAAKLVEQLVDDYQSAQSFDDLYAIAYGGSVETIETEVYYEDDTGEYVFEELEDPEIISPETPADQPAAAPAATTPKPPAKPKPRVVPNIPELHKANPDCIGWIYIEGTRLDYPVMHTPSDPEFYLKNGFNKKPSRSGVPFVDARCSVEGPSDNVIIYGHHLSSGTMFSMLWNYRQSSYLKKHPVIRFDTLYGNGEYRIFAVIKTDAIEGYPYHHFVNAKSEEHFNQYIADLKELQLYDTGFTPTYGVPIITLSTCEYSTKDGRLAVFAQKIN